MCSETSKAADPQGAEESYLTVFPVKFTVQFVARIEALIQIAV